MESFKLENLSFTYSGADRRALENISFTASRGEFILLCGKSGCGKTTLLRLLKPSLAPFGSQDGAIYYHGRALADSAAKEQAANIGFIMQSCENQLVTDKVWHELAFGLESLGCSTAEIRTRVSEMASFFGIEGWFYKKVSELSGGQKQLLALASVMVMQPEVLLLDEPTSQLDPIAAQEFLNTLKKINRELGTTILISEHRLEETLPAADRVIVIDNGRITADAEPRKIGGILKAAGHDLYDALPTPVRVSGALENEDSSPVTVREGRLWLESFAERNPLYPERIPQKSLEEDDEPIAVSMQDVWFRYERTLPDVIKGLTLRVKKGEFFALVGGNGTGKTTALSILAGLKKPYRGRVLLNGRPLAEIPGLYHGFLGFLPQNVQSLFVKSTVRLDLEELLAERKIPKEEREQRLQRAAALCHIEPLLSRHPYDLSGGEQQRAALAKILLTTPELLLLDEPTKGMDIQFKREFAEILVNLKAQGVTIIMVSHDIEFCAEYADRCALFFDGNITASGAPGEFFAGNSFYTTAASRMARTTLPKAILTEDILLACGGVPQEKKTLPPPKNMPSENQSPAPSAPVLQKQQKPKAERPTKQKLAASLFLLFSIPLTLFVGVRFLGNRKYYFTGLLIILEAMLPFFMGFERRKPKARELVMISVLCALAVAGRAAFFMLPQFKPVAALVMISGICFGGEVGFLVGAVTGFVSNFFFGQGPWTPWQMFAFGVLGLIAGLSFKAPSARKQKVLLCGFGFLVTLVVYGGIMNPASVIMWQDKITWEMLASACLTGLPFDLIHAASTAFFLWFLAEPMIEKLERIKIKFGVLS